MNHVLAEAEKNLNIVMDRILNGKDLARYIDHTVLKADTTQKDIERICQEAIENQFFGVCVPPYFVKHAKKLLRGSGVKTITVVGFPLGYSYINSKVEECKRALEDRAHEIDMVMNISAFKSGNFAFVKDDIQNITTLCRLNNRLIKVIIETSLLSKEEIIKACQICAEAEVDFVKTSTGFNGSGANIENIKLMRDILPKNIKIKASGGIKDNAFANELIKAGASRIGSSAGAKLLF
jgi:deoxyribose-phosphate aldolase